MLDYNQSGRDYASAGETNKPSEIYSPSAEEKRTIEFANKKYARAKAHRKIYDQKWVDWYRMFRGIQWNTLRPSYRHSAVVNFIFQTIQSMVPIILDARPKVSFLPQEPSDREFAELMNELCDSDWTRMNWLEVITEIVYDAHLYGTGITSLTYDETMDFGLGGLLFRSIDPLYVFPDPMARDVNKECRSFITAEPMDVDLIKSKYPDKAKYISADLSELIQDKKTTYTATRYRSPTDSLVSMEATPTEEFIAKDQALLITIYCHSIDYVEEEVADGFEQKLKYPRGRKIVICNNILLEDRDNPYEDGNFPYQRLQNYVLPREFWGQSEVEQLEGPQKIFNKIFSFALDVMTLMGNPIWIVDNSSSVDTNNIINRPGLVIEKEPGSEVRREEGVQLQPYVMQLADRLKEWFDQLGGSQDVTRGATPSGITAASAISSLQEAAQTRIRQKSRNLDMYLQNLGQQYLSRVLQFYTVPRVVRVTGKNEAERYFRFHIETSDDKKVAVVREYANAEDGTPVEMDAKKIPLNGVLDVKVTTGSTLPFAREEKNAKLLQLFDRGIIDDVEVLKNSDYPNYEAILQRKQEKLEQQMQMQQQAAAAPA